MKSGIYAIKNKMDNKMYIGQSNNIDKRMKYHLCRLNTNNHHNPHLQNAFNKYGKNNFIFKVLEYCNEKELNDKEIYYINHYNSQDKGYNMCGGGGGSLGRPLSEETKSKISRALTGRKDTKETRKLKSEISKKMWQNPEYREHMKQYVPTSTWNIGRKLTSEHKKKISEKMKGRYISEEHKQKLHELYKGENSITAKLTQSQVIEIRLRYLKGERQYIIAKDYPVTKQTIYDIVKGRRWKHVPNTIEELEKLREANK